MRMRLVASLLRHVILLGQSKPPTDGVQAADTECNTLIPGWYAYRREYCPDGIQGEGDWNRNRGELSMFTSS